MASVKSLFEAGGVVVVTVMLWVVWRRLNEVTDRLIDIQDEVRLQSLRTAPPGTQKDDET